MKKFGLRTLPETLTSGMRSCNPMAILLSITHSVWRCASGHRTQVEMMVRHLLLEMEAVSLFMTHSPFESHSFPVEYGKFHTQCHNTTNTTSTTSTTTGLGKSSSYEVEIVGGVLGGVILILLVGFWLMMQKGRAIRGMSKRNERSSANLERGSFVRVSVDQDQRNPELVLIKGCGRSASCLTESMRLNSYVYTTNYSKS